jgi:hypothetical protein
MSNLNESFLNLGVHIPEIHLPSDGIDLNSWAVVACDQYSSEREYWENVAGFVGAKPSTLNMIFPECYLEDGDKEERIAKIRSKMAEYLEKGYIESKGKGFVLVERLTPYEKEPRVGLVMALDLERYVYGSSSKSLIRPTEGTIVERLPPRMAIRRGAPLEVPHIMVLMDDPLRNIIEPLYAKRRYLPKVYDFDLMQNSGHLRAWKIADDANLEAILESLTVLADPEAYKAKYGDENVLLFAVGDGNHSLATAKAVWEEIKAHFAEDPARDRILAHHPARFALVELLNIYDEGLPFHPIHRVLFNVDARAFFADLEKAGAKVSLRPDSEKAFSECDASAGEPGHTIAFTSSKASGIIRFDDPVATIAAGSMQGFIDPWLKSYPATTIDYIHGSGSLAALASREGNLGLYLPPVDKSSFFETVIRNGVLPRKTFSMGEAPEKRFYMEARRISL